MESAAVASGGSSERAVLPSGQVTFLFTDIEGSTVRWDRDAGAMQEAVRRHDALMRAAIAEQGGVVFKTIGDAFCAAFWRVEDGLHAALGAQRALAAEDFGAVDGVRVRMALHVGMSDERDADYFGPTLNRVARLLAIGHGGQVLVSGAAAEAARDLLPPGATLTDLGEHRLKDLTAPEWVFQLDAPDLLQEFPRLRSLSAPNNNLPQQLTALIGRERDVAEIEALLQTSRLITLFGTGGLGKTRCAIQVGANLLEEYGDGVWFADLAPVADPVLIANTIAALFGARETPHRPMLETLVAHLHGKHTLLILDNCEHLTAEVSKIAAALLRACPKVKILATSRESLNVNGETVHRMPALAVPTSSRDLSAQTAMQYGAVELFDVRARATNRRFRMDDDNASTVAEICRRLDGIPLAIELAAARVKVLTPQQLLQRLDERFRLLTGGDRAALPRQQTLRALIDWSYDLLSEREQILFRYTAAFAGGFALDQATAVCATEEMEQFEIIDLLSSLTDKSLLMVEPAENDVRYRLLESMRSYAREKLFEHEEAEVVFARHAEAYTELAEQLETDYEQLPYREWIGRVEPELENVRAALSWSFGALERTLLGQRLAATLGRVLLTFAAAEARRWVKKGLELVDDATPPPIVARLELAEAGLASVLNQFRAALAAARRALVWFEQLQDRCGVADAQRSAGRSLLRLGQVPEGEELLRESLVTHRALHSRRVGGTLRELAVARGSQGDPNGARALFAQALETFRDDHDEENVAITAAALAETEFACGNPDAALPIAEEGLKAVRAMGRQRMAAAFLGNIAAYLVAALRFDSARLHAREALRLSREVEEEVSVAFALQHIAAVMALRPHETPDEAQSDSTRAARLMGFVDTRLRELEVEREFTEQHEYDAMLVALRAIFDEDARAALAAAGSGWSEDRAIAVALEA